MWSLNLEAFNPEAISFKAFSLGAFNRAFIASN